jgi:hypothetical protein
VTRIKITAAGLYHLFDKYHQNWGIEEILIIILFVPAQTGGKGQARA